MLIADKQSYDAPAYDKTFKQIPGRSGDLIIDNGKYPNIPIKYTMSLVRQCEITLADLTNKIKDWLLIGPGYFPLWDSYDPRYIRYASVTSGFAFSQEAKDVGTFPITFNCMPLKCAVDGLRAIEIPAAGATLINPEQYNSKPYIKVYGSGDITMSINSQTVTIDSLDGYAEMDSLSMTIYKAQSSLSSKMSGAFPVFVPGDNEISFTGNVTGAEIVPRWCRL